MKGKAMWFRAIWAVVATACFMPAVVSAQAIRTASSSGLTADVVGIVYAQGHVSAQVIIKNNNAYRVYLQDARADDSQTGFLGSGPTLRLPSLAGVPVCQGTYSQCISDQQNTTIDKFSYIDPGNSLGVALIYEDQQTPSNPDTLTFSLAMLSRSAKSATDNSPDDVGPVQEVSFSFPFVSFSPGQ